MFIIIDCEEWFIIMVTNGLVMVSLMIVDNV